MKLAIIRSNAAKYEGNEARTIDLETHGIVHLHLELPTFVLNFTKQSTTTHWKEAETMVPRVGR